MQIKSLNISILEENKGQINGVPANPRYIKDSSFKNLVQSIKELPEMLELRECIVFPLKNKFIILGGNMRYKACCELKLAEIPCKILNKNTPVDILRQIVIKDNGSYGRNDMDLIANEWEDYIQESWGVNEDAGYFQKQLKDETEEQEEFEKKLPYPITIVVTKSDYDKCQQIKRKYNEENDLKLFMKLIKNYDN